MKKIYFYDTSTKLLKLSEPLLVNDDFECPAGCSDKNPDVSKRARYIIEFDENDNNWVYIKRDSYLWCHVTDTPEHRERQSYYNAALQFYNDFKQSEVEYAPDEYKYNNNPDDLVEYLKTKVDIKPEMKIDSYTVEDVVRWIENYESTKDLAAY